MTVSIGKALPRKEDRRLLTGGGSYSDDVHLPDLAYAIESFVHGPDPASFFAQCRELVRPNGLLVICDDFRRPATDPAATRAIERFCSGWQINTLLRPDELRSLARGAGFEHESTVDLSPHLELHRPRDRAVNALLAILDRLPLDSSRFGHLRGGSALQTCLDRGWIGYDLALFRQNTKDTKDGRTRSKT